MAFEIELTMFIISIVFYLASFIPGIRYSRERGMIYMIMFRVAAMLLWFVAYSSMLTPVQTITAPYNVTTGNSITQYPQTVKTTELTAIQGQNLSYLTIAMEVLFVASAAIDAIWALRDG